MRNENYLENFKEQLQNHGVCLSDQQLKQFAEYAQLLQEWNQKMNLTAITDVADIYEKHFLDSILPSFDTLITGKLCDVGAGAGFPSIPLKIVYPQLSVTIVEPLGKRISFLTALTRELGLSVELINERAEDHASDRREYYDFVTARAVANLAMLSELCIPLVKLKGTFLAMKGSAGTEEYYEAEAGIQKLGCRLAHTYTNTLQDGSKRINLEFYKEHITPKQYPRPFASIKKHPLRGGTK